MADNEEPGSEQKYPDCCETDFSWERCGGSTSAPSDCCDGREVDSESQKRASIASSTSNHDPLCSGVHAQDFATSSPDPPLRPAADPPLRPAPYTKPSRSHLPTHAATCTTTYQPLPLSPTSASHSHSHTKRLSTTLSRAPTLARKLRCACDMPSAVLKDSGHLFAAGGRAVSEYWKPSSRTTSIAGSSSRASTTGSSRASTAWSSRTASSVASASGGEWDGEGEPSAVYDFGRLGLGIEDIARYREGEGEGKGKGKGKAREGDGRGDGDGDVVIYGADEWGSRVGARYGRFSLGESG
ncbi:hypothetical protein MMC27_005653 [Xylographa pallens]|nr:hypothetical protein [Xylographa pallens]